MSKKVEKKSINVTNLLFLIGYAVVTIFVIVFTLIMCAEPFVISDYEEMKQVTYDEYKSQKADEYYVIIYSDQYIKSEWYEEIAIEYANYARTHSSATPIYGYNLDGKGNSKITNDIRVSSSTPEAIIRLVKISNGSIGESFTSWDDIHNELTEAMTLEKDAE